MAYGCDPFSTLKSDSSHPEKWSDLILDGNRKLWMHFLTFHMTEILHEAKTCAGSLFWFEES